MRVSYVPHVELLLAGRGIGPDGRGIVGLPICTWDMHITNVREALRERAERAIATCDDVRSPTTPRGDRQA